jgi:hypothetical protein
MPRQFWRATAEAVVACVDAVVVSAGRADIDYVAEFTQLIKNHAESALELAVDLGLLAKRGGKFAVNSPLCRALVTASQKRKASALRVVLEDYIPFIAFRERLIASDDASVASRQTKLQLDLTSHPDDVKETLLSLGQYSQALVAEGGGVYRTHDVATDYDLAALAQGCANDAAAEQLIRARIGPRAHGGVSREDVIVPLTTALQHARAGDGRGAVVSAGNAVESYLAALGGRVGINVAGNPGINAKAQALNQNSAVMPGKLLNMSKYLGHVRNAADHGIDPEVQAPWSVQASTGLEYVFVACSFVSAVSEREAAAAPII